MERIIKIGKRLTIDLWTLPLMLLFLALLLTSHYLLAFFSFFAAVLVKKQGRKSDKIVEVEVVDEPEE